MHNDFGLPDCRMAMPLGMVAFADNPQIGLSMSSVIAHTGIYTSPVSVGSHCLYEKNNMIYDNFSLF